MYTCYPFPIEMNIVHGRNRPWLFVNIHQNKHNSESTGVVPSGAYSNPPIGSKKLKIFIDNNKIFQEYIAQEEIYQKEIRMNNCRDSN